MEKDEIFASDNVRHAVAVVGNWSEAATSRDAIRMFGQIQFGCLTVRCLRCRQSPRLAQDFLEERRIDFQVL